MSDKAEQIELEVILDAQRGDPMQPACEYRADLRARIAAIRAEPELPASDAGAEIVAMLEEDLFWLESTARDLRQVGKPNSDLESRADLVRHQLGKARKILARHQSRPVVAADDDLRRAIEDAIRSEPVVDDDLRRAINRAQYPQPTGGA